MVRRSSKINDDIIDIVLDESRKNPDVSCRVLSRILEKKLAVKLSKSSINSILKDRGVSAKVGRKRKIRNTFNASESVPDQLPVILPPLHSMPVSGISEALAPVEPAAHKEEAPIVPPALPVALPAPTISSVPEVPEAPEAPEAPLLRPPSPLVGQTIEPSVVPAQLVPVPEGLAKLVEGQSIRTLGGFILLRVMDFLVQGIRQFCEAITKRTGNADQELAAKLELITYQEFMLSFLRVDLDYLPLQAYLGVENCDDIVKKCVEELIPLFSGGAAAELERARRAVFRDVRSFRITLSDGKTFCFDSQHHTVWSTLNIPHEFSATEAELKRCLSPELEGASPFVLFIAPGYDVPTKDFFHFIGSLDNGAASFVKCTLHGSASDEVDVIQARNVRRQCVFAIWPWQFTNYRAVKKLDEFTPFTDEKTGLVLYRAGIELELRQPELSQAILFAGYALKSAPAEKTRIVILSYGMNAEDSMDGIVREYFRHWPNTDEAFRDFSRKVELFTYTTAQQFGGAGSVSVAQPVPDTGTVPFLRRYASSLAAYFRKAFLPAGPAKENQDTLTSPFFSSFATVERHKCYFSVLFEAANAAYAKDLEYACFRLNERCIRFQNLPVSFHIKSA